MIHDNVTLRDHCLIGKQVTHIHSDLLTPIPATVLYRLLRSITMLFLHDVMLIVATGCVGAKRHSVQLHLYFPQASQGIAVSDCVYVCMHVYVCVCTYACIYVRMCVCMCVSLWMYDCMYACMSVEVRDSYAPSQPSTPCCGVV